MCVLNDVHISGRPWPTAMNLKIIASGRESKIWEMHAKALPRRQTTRVYNVGRSFKISVCFSGKKSVNINLIARLSVVHPAL